MRRRLLVGTALLAGLGVMVALGISRIDFERALREVTLPLRHEDIIRQQAAEKDLDPALVAAVIYAESRFRARISHADARGLMQVTPRTARSIARKSGGIQFVVGDLSDPDINIRYGTFHLRDMLNAYGGNVVAALAAYNAGSGNVDRWGGAELEIDDIGFPETHAYVRDVLQKQEEYRKHYAGELGID